VDVFGNLDYLEVMNHTRVLDEDRFARYTEKKTTGFLETGN